MTSDKNMWYDDGMLKVKSLENVVLVTHKGCLDGAGCVILFLNAGGKIENVKFVAAGMLERFVKSDASFESNSIMIFTDVGVNLPKYADIIEKRGNVVLLDHHVTSAHMKNREWCVIDNDKNGMDTRCGCVMFLEYLRSCGGKIEQDLSSKVFDSITATIDDLDRWLCKDPLAEDLATLMAFLGQKEFIDRFWNVKERWADTGWGCFRATFFGRDELWLVDILKKRRDEAITTAIKKSVVRNVTYLDSKGNEQTVPVAYVITSEPNVSLLLDRLGEAKPDALVCAQVNVDKRVVSLRSQKIDVAEMAKYFRGGGHKNAAGHPLPADFVDVIIEEVHT